MNKPQKAHDLDIRTVGDEVLVHHPAAQKVHILNRTAGQILEMCNGERTPEDIVASICSETSADKEAVARDVAAMLGEFSKLGLVTA
ncbi:MAG: HPr-rel-A system PqqD family peptide chaperone [Candidatus Eremiobacteraeota bacterium]|nr:HPr-rel-A system PqqD family peptide chaperone [Candidatus Eremiobacteraeota bacterium]